MTPQEQQMIDGLITRIRSTQITDRDPVAADHLQQGLGSNPDALYILAQTVLVQQHSLEQAHAQMEQLEQQLESAQKPAAPNTLQAQPQQQSSTGSTWLSRFFGTDSTQTSGSYTQPPQSQAYSAPSTPYQAVNAGTPSPYAYPQQPYPPQTYPPQGYAPPGYAQQGYGSPFGQPMGMGGGGSFLRTAVQTAAGVAAGEMLFQGVESMFGGGHHSSNFGGGGGETINNYYGDDRSNDGEHHHEAAADSSFYNPSADASRGDGGSGNLTQNQEDSLDDSSYSANDSNDDNSNNISDDSSSDDSSSYDDSSDNS